MSRNLTFPIADTGERTLPTWPGLYAFKRIYRLVSERFGGSDKNALDYGCGSGYGTSMLAESFHSVTGVDVSDQAIAYCLDTYHIANLDFKIFDPRVQPFPGHSFDRVFSFQVFEHVPPDMATTYLSFIWEMLKPSGVAVITTPKAENYYRGYSGNPFHLKEYRHDELQRVLAAVLPSDCFRIMTIEDVPSTILKSKIMRYSHNAIPARVVCRLLVPLLSRLEQAANFRISHHNMIKSGDHIIGSYYVEITKPA